MDLNTVNKPTIVDINTIVDLEFKNPCALELLYWYHHQLVISQLLPLADATAITDICSIMSRCGIRALMS